MLHELRNEIVKMSSERVPNEMKMFLRSVCMSANGVKESKLEKDYFNLACEKLNWRKLGFRSLREFLCAIPDVCRLQYNAKDKENRVYAVELKGTFMSSHAKKNVKCASSVVPIQSLLNADTKTLSLSPTTPSGRKVQHDGGSLKITIAEEKEGEMELMPNNNGLYQVYVANLSQNCTQSDLKKSFSTYGIVKEADIVTSSRHKKYASKKEAVLALTDANAHPPEIQGQAVEVGFAKRKNASVKTCVKTVLNFKPVKESETMLSISPPPSSTRTSALNQPPQPNVLPLFKNDMQDKHFPTGDSLDEPLYAVNVSGYNRKITENDICKAFQNTGNIAKFKYHPMYSIIKFKTKSEALNAVQDMNGKWYMNGVFLVTALKQNWPVNETKPVEETKPVKETKAADEIKAIKEKEIEVKEFEGTKDEFSEIYSLYDKAVVDCCGQQYLLWLNSLSLFEMKVIGFIDPCTFWVHIHDGSYTYKKFENLVDTLAFLDNSSNQKRLEKNQFGAGLFSEDGEWYRCYCFDVSPDKKHLHVMYIDYGNCEWLETEKVISLTQHFFQLRPMSVLVRLSGLKFNPNQDEAITANTFLTAKHLLMKENHFKAKKVLLDPSKPLLLEIEILKSEGETIYKKLSSLPGIEVLPRPSSPVQLFLLPLSPLPDDKSLVPLKKGLVEIKPELFFIWITNITSPTTFHFQLANERSRKDIKGIQELLLMCNIKDKVDIKHIKENELVCYHKNGHERSRVRLLSSSRPQVPGQVNVLHVDIGKEAMVPCTSFISLPSTPQFCFQARPAVLYNVPDKLTSHSSDALDLIVQKSSQVLRANILEESVDGCVSVELFDVEGESVNKNLLEMVNNNQTTSAQTLSPRKTMLGFHTSAATQPRHFSPERSHTALHNAFPPPSNVDTSRNVKHPVTAPQVVVSQDVPLSGEVQWSPATSADNSPLGPWGNGTDDQKGVNPVRNSLNFKTMKNNVQSPSFPEVNSTGVQSRVIPSKSEPVVTTNTKITTKLPSVVAPAKTELHSQVGPSGATLNTTVEKSQDARQEKGSPFILKQGNPGVPAFNTSPGFTTLKYQTVPAVGGTESSNTAFLKTNEQNSLLPSPSKEMPSGEAQKNVKPNTNDISVLKKGFPSAPPCLPSAPPCLPGGVVPGVEPGKSQEGVPPWQAMDYEALKSKIQEQEKTLLRPVAEQRQLLVNKKTKEKLEVQVRIKVLENSIFALENELQSLKLQKDAMEMKLQE